MDAPGATKRHQPRRPYQPPGAPALLHVPLLGLIDAHEKQYAVFEVLRVLRNGAESQGVEAELDEVADLSKVR